MRPVSSQDVAIVGGGLVGSLLSIFLARRGFEVALYERRRDPRRTEQAAGRSINLVVTSRGLAALRRLGLEARVARLTVPVLGRMVHSQAGELSYQPYGRDDSEHNHSISRGELNRFLLDEAERLGVGLEFDRALVAADLPHRRLFFEDVAQVERFEVEAGVVFGADGAGSALRGALAAQVPIRESVEMLEHGYKELSIPAGPGGSFRIDGRALHIWPRGGFMMMALPNRDGSFTVTLYLPHRGPGSFASLEGPRRVREFFEEQFADSLGLIDDLEASFGANPTGELGTVRCDPWHHDACVLIGDAAHAIVPFFGQGMNCGFEDCSVLDELLDRHGAGDWAELLSLFGRERKPDADAIAEMALENFVEMRDRVGDAAFLLRKQVERVLERELSGEYRSRYSMVVYSTLPYRVAREAGRIEDAILDELCAGLQRAEDLDLARARALIHEKLAPYLASRGASLDY